MFQMLSSGNPNKSPRHIIKKLLEKSTKRKHKSKQKVKNTLLSKE